MKVNRTFKRVIIKLKRKFTMCRGMPRDVKKLIFEIIINNPNNNCSKYGHVRTTKNFVTKDETFRAFEKIFRPFLGFLGKRI